MNLSIKSAASVLALGVFLAPALALADQADKDACAGLAEGDDCTDGDGKAGYCMPDASDPQVLTCEDLMTGSGGSGGSGASGSGGSAGSGGSGGSGGSAGSGGSGEDLGSCAASPGPAGMPPLVALALGALGIAVARRRRTPR